MDEHVRERDESSTTVRNRLMSKKSNRDMAEEFTEDWVL